MRITAIEPEHAARPSRTSTESGSITANETAAIPRYQFAQLLCIGSEAGCPRLPNLACTLSGTMGSLYGHRFKANLPIYTHTHTYAPVDYLLPSYGMSENSQMCMVNHSLRSPGDSMLPRFTCVAAVPGEEVSVLWGTHKGE